MLFTRRILRPIAVLLLLPFATAQRIATDSVPSAPRAPLASLSQSFSVQKQEQQQESRAKVKVLVCGDSISQGNELDFTWRYRLWEWFQQHSTTATPALQFVGPYNGTLPDVVPTEGFDPDVPQTWGAYHPSVAPAFSPGGGSAHFAVYGRPAWQDIDLLEGQVATYQPDMVMLHLGFNDIGWWGQTPEELAEIVHKLISKARLARSDVKVLVADVSHRLSVGGREDIAEHTEGYDVLLGSKVAEWSLPESPVMVVRVSEEYDCHLDSCPAGFDGLHPNALGDFQIARAYTKVLHERFGYGDGPLVVPSVESIALQVSEGADGEIVALPGPQESHTDMIIAMSGLYLTVVVIVLRWRRKRGLDARYLRLPMTANGEGA